MGQSRRASEQRSSNQQREMKSTPAKRENSRTESIRRSRNESVNRSATSRSNNTELQNRRNNQRQPSAVRPTRQDPQRQTRKTEPADNNTRESLRPRPERNERTTSPSRSNERPEVNRQREYHNRDRNVQTHHNRSNEARSANRNHYKSSRKYVKRHDRVHYRRGYTPRSREYRATHHVYRRPVHVDIVWSPRVYHEYRVIYPELRHWRYNRHYRIHTISAYDAYYHIGEIRRVYGRVSDVYYEPRTDEYFLYIGDYYPYHDLSIVVPGHIARMYSRRPLWYFKRGHIAVTGLISVWDESPEIVIGRGSQLTVY